MSDIGLTEEDLQQLVEVDVDSWSAITVSAYGRDMVIYNPRHFSGRYASDVMHELAHLVLGHDPTTMFFVGDGELALGDSTPPPKRKPTGWPALCCYPETPSYTSKGER